MSDVANKLRELAERCEKATADSFDLNHAIAIALGIASEPFTASLDAAMTLVPEGRDQVLMNVKVESFHVGENDRRHMAKLFAPYSGEYVEGRSATPALALCAAALRARAAQ
jgi:hypothetical protein